VEEAIRKELAQVRPADRVVGEEYGDAGGGPRRWIIDPIDGTKNFVRRIPVWATLIALEVEGRMEVGVVSAPALGRRWWAARGEGAWVDDGTARRISVSKVASLADAHLSGASLSSWDDWGGPAVYLALAGRCYADRSFGDFWSHMLVAEGGCDIGLDPIVSLWDLAALQVIVEEAGGTFTSFGGEARADGGSAISSNGLLHDQVRSILTGGQP
jgi:histidinol-phosphatase